jgi:small conductance mechanosensitive channel
MQTNDHFLNKVMSNVGDVITHFGLKLLFSVIILVAGIFIIKRVKKVLTNGLNKKDLDKSIVSFSVSLINGLMWISLVIIVLSSIGVQSNSFIAVIGAASIAIALALQGMIANFASGFIIIVLRPFCVGDTVEVDSYRGTVTAIHMMQTHLSTYDNRKVIIPNSHFLNTTIINITNEPIRRVDFEFHVELNSDIAKVKNVLENIVKSNDKILKNYEKNNIIRMTNIGRDCLDFAFKVWCKKEDYWTLYYDIPEIVKNEFDKNEIILPHPQMEVKIMKE